MAKLRPNLPNGFLIWLEKSSNECRGKSYPEIETQFYSWGKSAQREWLEFFLDHCATNLVQGEKFKKQLFK